MTSTRLLAAWLVLCLFLLASGLFADSTFYDQWDVENAQQVG